MKFVKTDDLKAGMRLAKPIYNKNGVLLYDRNSTLTAPGIVSIRNFGLFGIYILEPAEPVPPLSREDLEFEQLQTIYMFKLRVFFNNRKAQKNCFTSCTSCRYHEALLQPEPSRKFQPESAKW